MFPAMTLELTRSSGSSKYEVRGFGRREGALYLIVRLHESMDFSLRKGWGKTFQLTDNTGKKYLYNSVSLPNAVEIHDTFVDLPNDIRARQTVLAGGYRDLVLIFPEFSKDATPVSLLVIEDFLGNSPANPGITYEEARIEKTGEVREIRPVMAMSPGKKSYQGSGTAGDGTTFKLKQVIIDQSVQWQISLEVSAHRQTVITLNDAVLVDEGGANYNLVQKDEVQTVNLKENGTEILNLSFEPLPATVEKMVLWLQYTTAAGMPNEVRFEISQAG
ncbi:hypothetical protein [Moorella sp. ACPs]|uniref:hypothetical protein n=1 Tax=Neomoorella carbonis TaxID=3062783 RepID=UPI00387377CA